MQSPATDNGSKVPERYRLALVVTAIYDGLLGLAFLFLSGPIFRMLGVAVTAEPVYVQLAAGLIAILGLGFFLAWREPLIDRDIVLLGTVFKAFYILLAISAQIRGQLPHWMFLLFAGIDAVFLIIFLSYLRDTRAARSALPELLMERTGP
jgi:hypothetical protein